MPPSTHKKTNQPSTQEYLDISEIRENVVILRDGSMRMVIMATAINFSLKSEEEQNAIIYQYQNFLNALNFPIEIVIQSRKTDLTSYITKLKERLNQETNELIRMQIHDYIEFIDRIINIANIMNKKFYLVIPLFPPNLKKRGLFDKIMNPKTTMTVKISPTEFSSFKEEMLERCSVIISGLGGLGVRAQALNTQQLVELYYSSYNPEEAQSEKLTEINKLQSSIISKTPEEEKENKDV